MWKQIQRGNRELRETKGYIGGKRVRGCILNKKNNNNNNKHFISAELDVLNTSIVIAPLCSKSNQEYESKRIILAVGCTGIYFLAYPCKVASPFYP